MKNIFLFTFFFISIALKAQFYPELLQLYGTNENYKLIRDVVKDESGNKYLTGESKSTTFGGVLRKTPQNAPNGFIYKEDADGNFLWFYTVESDEDSSVEKIGYLDGFIYIAGSFRGNTSFKMVGGAKMSYFMGENTSYFAKITVTGETEWVKILSGNVTINSIIVENEGIFLTGINHTVNNVIFNPEDPSVNFIMPRKSLDSFLVKYNLNGNYQWHRHLSGASGRTEIQDLCISEGFLYSYGRFQNSLYHSDGFNVDTLKTNGRPAGKFIQKLNAVSGNVEFLKLSSLNTSFANDSYIKVHENNIWVLGLFSDTLFIYPGASELKNNLSNSSFASFPYIINYDTNGNYVGAKSFYGNSTSILISSVSFFENNLALVLDHNTSEISFITQGLQGAQKFKLPKENGETLFKLNKNGHYVNHNFLYTHQTNPAISSSVYIGNTHYDLENLTVYGKSIDPLNFSLPFDSLEITLPIINDAIFTSTYKDAYGSDWQNSQGSSQSLDLSVTTSTCMDDSGNVYSLGYFENSIVLKDLHTSNGGKDLFLAKYDPFGNILWVRKAGGAGEDLPGDILWADGHIYITGSFEQTINFSLTATPMVLELSSIGNKDIFLVKYDAINGEPLWIRRAGGSQADHAERLAFYNGYVYVAGNFRTMANFNSPSSTSSFTLSSRGGDDVFLWKLTSTGSNIWVRRAGGNNFDEAMAISAGENGIFLGGSFNETADFNTPSSTTSNSLTSIGDRDMFIAKFDEAGSLIWLTKAGGKSRDRLLDLNQVNNRLLISGSFSDTLLIGTPVLPGQTLISKGNRDGCLISLHNDTGVFQWSRHLSGEENVEAKKIELRNDDILVGGTFEGRMQFGSRVSDTLSSEGESDIFIGIFGFGGVFKGFMRAGGTLQDELYDLDANDDRFVYSGSFLGTANFNTPSSFLNRTLSSQSANRGFTARASYGLRFTTVFKQADDPEKSSFEPERIFTDVDGFSYLTGQMQNSFSQGNVNLSEFDNSLNLNTEQIILKTDNYGKAIWGIQLIGEDGHRIYEWSSPIVAGNNLYLAGQYIGNLTFNTTPDFNSNTVPGNPNGKSKVFLASFNKDTQAFNWAIYAEASTFEVRNPELCSDGTHIYLSGYFQGTLYMRNLSGNIIGSFVPANSNKHSFLAKIDANGQVLWINAEDIGTSFPNGNNGLVFFNNTIYKSGIFTDNVLFFNTQQTLVKSISSYDSGSESAYLSSYNLQGDLLWAKPIYSNLNEKELSLAVNSTGLYFGVSGSEFINFSEPYNSNLSNFQLGKDENLALIKFDFNGNMQWLRVFEFNDSDYDRFTLKANEQQIFVVSEIEDGNIYLKDPQNASYNYSIESDFNDEIFIGNFSPTGDYLGGKTSGQGEIYFEDASIYNGTITLVGEIDVTALPWFGASPTFKFEPIQYDQGYIMKISNCDALVLLESPIDDISLSVVDKRSLVKLDAQNKINENARVNYISTSIELKPGFSTELGSVFQAVTGGCGND